MITTNESSNSQSTRPVGHDYETCVSNWYAVQTRARHEKIIAYRLQKQGIPTFLPLISEVHRWSDRTKIIELPLFNCYLFARLAPTNEAKLRVLCVNGVFQLVGSRGEGTPIPDNQIESIRALVEQHLPL